MLSVNSEQEAKHIVERRLKVAELKRGMANLYSKSSTEHDIGTSVHSIVQEGNETKKVVVSAVDTVGVKGHITGKEVS